MTRASWAERAKCSTYGCMAERQPDWTRFDKTLPSGVAMSDVDGVLYNRDHDSLLWVEWKVLPPGQAEPRGIERGQLGPLVAMSRRPGCTSIVVYCFSLYQFDFYKVEPLPFAIRIFEHGACIARSDAINGEMLDCWVGEWWRTGAWPSADVMTRDMEACSERTKTWMESQGIEYDDSRTPVQTWREMIRNPDDWFAAVNEVLEAEA